MADEKDIEIDLEKDLRNLIFKLRNFVDSKKEADFEDKKLTSSFLKYFKNRVKMLEEEKYFEVPKGIVIKRGMVFWTDFGVNVGEEFGGKHPALVLRVGGKTAIVVPLSSKTPTDEQLKSGAYVEINKVYGLRAMTRWANVLNVQPVSIQRFDFESSFGNVKGYILDSLSEAIKKCGLWK